MRIAIEGCTHGELDATYETIAECEKKDGRKVDLLLCCGDFQVSKIQNATFLINFLSY